ncbi:uncharacterized protein LOC133525228 [Cydia pomonella]|uniref:uncharacterized protein LOC133525228 n=1 Tax=Cydia pomonella TaxID=82600 RepID=UPI002ADE1F78|nr:uncharacterized protein LOC133525228 [Cydia pomonella]
MAYGWCALGATGQSENGSCQSPQKRDDGKGMLVQGILRLRGGGSPPRDSKGRFTRGQTLKGVETGGTSVVDAGIQEEVEAAAAIHFEAARQPTVRVSRLPDNTGAHRAHKVGAKRVHPKDEDQGLENEPPKINSARRGRKASGAGSVAPRLKLKSSARVGTKAAGHYVGLSAARNKLRNSVGPDTEQEDEYMDDGDCWSESRASSDSEDTRPTPGTEVSLEAKETLVLEFTEGQIIEEVCSEAKNVLEEARKSGNLNGQVHGRINASCRRIIQAMQELQSREEGEELRILKADNKRMKQQLAQLQTETKALRKAYSERNKKAKAVAPASALEAHQLPEIVAAVFDEFKEDLKKELFTSLGNMINVRIGEVRALLPPAPTLRPPLAADRKRAAAAATTTAPPTARPNNLPDDPWTPLPVHAPVPAPVAKPRIMAEKALASTGSTLMPPARAAPGPKVPRRKQVTTEQVLQGAPPPPQNTEAWTEVKRRAKKHPRSKKAKATKPPIPAPRKKLPVPRSAAIVVALKPGVEASYASVMAKATTSLKLAEVGLEHVTMRKTADGARIIEIPGADNARAADDLRDKIEGLVGDVARVYRPVKMARVQVAGLDETATPDLVAAAVMAKGGCPKEQVKVGNIRMVRIGSGSALVQCPVTVANILLASGRLTVGWASAQIRALGVEPMRCYRCMGTGHTRATCPSPVDRSELCHRCSKPGHKVAECRAEPFCAVCHHAKRPHRHHMGGKGCSPPKARGLDTPARTPEASAPAPAKGETPMEGINATP